jgi:hypothetical protein
MRRWVAIGNGVEEGRKKKKKKFTGQRTTTDLRMMHTKII